MTHRQRSSNPSAGFQLEWRPSRWLIGCLLVMVTLSIFAIFQSEAPGWLAIVLSLSALLYGAACIRVEARRPAHLLLFGGDGKLYVDGIEVSSFWVAWRGPAAFVGWTDAASRRHRLTWWPDRLPADARRQLRLAAADCVS